MKPVDLASETALSPPHAPGTSAPVVSQGELATGRSVPAAPELSAADRARLSSDYLKLLIETYRHHFDLFVKGWFLYFGIVGAVGSYLSKGDVSSDVRLAAAMLIEVA